MNFHGLNAQSQWSTDPALNNTIIRLPVSNQDSPSIAKDGFNGAVIAWVDKNTLDIYAQRIDEAGSLLWAERGAPVAVGPQEQKSPSLTGDNQGNVFIAWLDRGNLFGDAEVLVQKFSRNGQPRWPSPANPSPTLAHAGEHSSPRILLNEIFEVITASYSTFGIDDIILVQIINDEGQERFDFFEGIVSQDAKGRQPDQPPAVVRGLSGGIIATWADGSVNKGVIVKGIRGTGDAWAAGGKVLSDTVTVNTFPVAVPDGNQGAIILWIEPISASNDIIMAARLDSIGANVWLANARRINTTSGRKKNLKAIPDGANGTFLIWENTAAESSIRLQRVFNQDGNSWSSDIKVSEFDLVEPQAKIIHNGAGKAIVVWQNTASDIFAQFFNPDGQTAFPAAIAVSTAAGVQRNPVLVDDGIGGAIIAWEDLRNGDSDIYVQRVNVKGSLGEFRTIELNSPNVAQVWEVGSSQTFRWTASEEIENLSITLSRDGGQNFEILDLSAPNNGSYDWQVTGPPASQCLVKIQARGSSFLFDQSEQTFTIVEQQGPELTPEIAVVAEAGESVEITSLATDVTGIAEISLNVRPGGARVFGSIPMSEVGENQFKANIPASQVTERGVEYFISSTDNIGTSSSTDTFFVSVAFSEGVQTSQIASGSVQTAYRMISSPNLLETTLADSIFAMSGFGAYDTTSWRLFEYRDGTNVERDSVNTRSFRFDAGRAFWVISSRNRTIDFGAGLSRSVDNSIDILLQPGWNQIGQPFAFAVAWDDITANGNVSLPYSYLGSYATANRLQPYQGYFVFNLENQPVTLSIPPLEFAPPLSLAKELSAADWQVQIASVCEDARDEYNFLGIHRQASPMWDALDQPEPPPIGEYISLYFPKQDWQNYPNDYTTDYRDQIGSGQVWKLNVRSNIRDAEAQIKFSGLQTVPADLKVVLVDEHLNLSQDLRVQPSFTFPTGHFGTTKSLKVVIGLDEFVASEIDDQSQVPADFYLDQNFPNPFNPATSIRYGLPRASEVTIKIYDLLGREVVTLVNIKQQVAGNHLVTWNGRDNNDRAVASGVYFYRIAAGNFIRTHKMLLVK